MDPTSLPDKNKKNIVLPDFAMKKNMVSLRKTEVSDIDMDENGSGHDSLRYSESLNVFSGYYWQILF